MFTGWLQVIRADLKLIRAENADVCRPRHLAKKNTTGEAAHTTEGCSWKLDQIRVLVTVGLHFVRLGCLSPTQP